MRGLGLASVAQIGFVLSAAAGLVTGEPAVRRLTTDGLEKARPAWSPDGRNLIFTRHESNGAAIWIQVLTDGNPATLRRLTDRKEPECHAAFSRDGSRVYFASVTLSGTQGNLDITAVGLDGGGLAKVVGDQGKLAHQDWPAVSPDGKRLAFSSTHEGNQEIYTAKIDGTDLVRLTQSPGHDAHPCWSPDGTCVAFATDRWGGLEIASVKADGTGLTRLTRSPGLDDYPAISPDGRTLAFVSLRDGQFEVYTADVNGADPVNRSRHPGRDGFPCWTPDGRGLTIVSDRDGGSDLYTIPFHAGR